MSQFNRRSSCTTRMPSMVSSKPVLRVVRPEAEFCQEDSFGPIASKVHPMLQCLDSAPCCKGISPFHGPPFVPRQVIPLWFCWKSWYYVDLNGIIFLTLLLFRTNTATPSLQPRVTEPQMETKFSPQLELRCPHPECCKKATFKQRGAFK
jgi:hypothetical protein